MKNKYIIGTVITAIFLGLMIGQFLGGILSNLFDIGNEQFYFLIVPILVAISISLYFGLKSPVKLEKVAYGVAILLILQWMWDLRVQDWNEIRKEIAITSLLSLIINMLTGQVRISGAKKTFKGQIGVK